MIAITGATRKFAAMEIRLNSPESRTIMGKHEIVAESGIAKPSANNGGAPIASNFF